MTEFEHVGRVNPRTSYLGEMKVAGKSRFDVLSFAHESSHKNRLLFFLDFSIRERRKQSNNQKCKSNIREWMEAFKNILIFRRIVQRGIYILLHERAKYPIVSKLRRPRLSLSRETVSRQFGIARFLCFLAKQSTSTVHTISSPLPLLPETFSRENKESPGGSR